MVSDRKKYAIVERSNIILSKKYMKIKKQTNKKRILTILGIVLLILALLASYSFIAYKKSLWPFAQHLNSDETQTPNGRLDENVAGQNSDDKAKGPTTAVEPTEPVGGDAKLTITQLVQTDNRVLVKASLENVSAGGRCIAYFESEGGAVSKYMTLADGDTVCSLDVSALEFSYLGKWSVRVVYSTTDDKKLESTGEVIIK